MTSARPQPRPGLLAVAILCAGLLTVGLIADDLPWLTPAKIAVQRTPSQLPSSLAVPPGELDRPGAVLSIYIEEQFLRHPGYGLLNHRQKRGRAWERPAFMSYFEDGELKFASPVGLRLHGGHTRTFGKWGNMRLYFRREYDSAQFRPSMIFGGRRNPIKRLIVDSAWNMSSRNIKWRLNNALAYDIARQVGALAPETYPVSFVFNGQPLGLYALVEPIRRTFLESRFGHDNFERANLSHNQRPSQPDDFELPDPWQRQPFLEVLEELKGQAAPLTLAEASRWIDTESLTRWFVSIVFCVTTDPFQAAILRDRTHPDSLWFWVNWDMDHSFTDMYEEAPTPWLHDTFRITLERIRRWEKKNRIEAYLIGRLLAEDPAYRDYLVREFLDALNHRLTPAFLHERYRYYRMIAERFGLGDEPYLEEFANFVDFRSAHVREQLVRELNLAPLRQVRIEGPRGTAFRVDGHAVVPGFSGWYVSGTEIHVEIGGRGGTNFSHWTVGGEQVSSPELRRQVEEDIVIEAKFRT